MENKESEGLELCPVCEENELGADFEIETGVCYPCYEIMTGDEREEDE